MTLRKRHGRWHYRIWINGREYTGATPYAATRANETAAKLVEAQARIEAEQREFPELRPSPSFSQAADQFLTWCDDVQYRGSESTARRLRVAFASLRDWFTTASVTTITQADVEAYKAWRLVEHRVRANTLRNDLSALSLFFQWLASQGWPVENYARAVKKPKPESVYYSVSRDEERAYLAAAAVYPALFDLARLMLETGARPDELLHLRVADVSLLKREMRITASKTGAGRRLLPLTSAAIAVLRRRAKPGRTWIFESPHRPGHPMTKLNKLHDLACAAAGVNFRLYDLRHTFATRAIVERGIDPVTVARLLGHNSLRMVTTYANPQQDHLRAAMDQFEKKSKRRSA